MRIADIIENLIGRPHHRLRATHISGYRIRCSLDDAVQRSVFYRGTFEPRLSCLVLDELVPGDIFLDVGANIGHYSFLAARKLADEGRVLSIEASRDTATQLRQTVVDNGLGDVITVYQVAAADTDGQMRLVHPTMSASRLGMRFLDPDALDREEEYELVEVTRLDDYLATPIPTVVKIDIEGADLRALIGMERWLRDSPPRLIVVEAIDAQLARFGDSILAMTTFMDQFGYRACLHSESYEADTIIFRR